MEIMENASVRMVITKLRVIVENVGKIKSIRMENAFVY